MYNWKNKKVLITGAGGFIGSHLSERLVAEGAQVKVFIRYNSRGDRGMLEFVPKEVADNIEIVMGDIRDAQGIRSAVKGSEIIFHLAALTGVPYSYIHPGDVIENNIYGILNILEAAREFDFEKIVHTSTSEVYGTAQYTPVDEKHPLEARSPYSASKISADKLAESFYISFGIPVATVRPFNCYGPRQSARTIMPTIITQALKGGEVYLGATSSVKDFTFVKDTVDGFVKTAESKKSADQAINIGTGVGISIKDLADKTVKIIGKNNKIIFDAKRVRPKLSEAIEIIADNKKAKELLSWEPKISLEEGLKETIAWYEQKSDIYKAGLYNI